MAFDLRLPPGASRKMTLEYDQVLSPSGGLFHYRYILSTERYSAQPLESAGNMVLHPVDTVTGLPSGVGRFFDRVGSGAGRLWNTATDSDKSGLERTGDTVTGVGTATKDVLGY